MENFKKEIKGSLFNYERFIDFVAELVEQGKTTGPNQTEAFVGYTILNNKRMQRLNKTTKLSDDFKVTLSNIKGKITALLMASICMADTPSNISHLARASMQPKRAMAISM